MCRVEESFVVGLDVENVTFPSKSRSMVEYKSVAFIEVDNRMNSMVWETVWDGRVM